MECFEPAFHQTWSQRRPSLHWSRDALEVLCSEVLKLKQIAHELPSALTNDHTVRLSNPLQARCEIGCLADYSAFLRFARSDKVTDNNKPGGNANARMQRDR